MSICTATWHASKRLPTFTDTLAFGRQQPWPVALFDTSQEKADVIEIPRAPLSVCLKSSPMQPEMDKVELNSCINGVPQV
jgi:hypothetical protein